MKTSKMDLAALRSLLKVSTAERGILERRVAELEKEREGAAARFTYHAGEKIKLQEERDRLWRQVQAINLISMI